MKQTAMVNLSKQFAPGKIMVVLKSGFSALPTFFKVVPSNLANMVCLQTLNTVKDKNGAYVPGEIGYHVSLCRTEGNVIETWCGPATEWEGTPSD